MEQNEGEAQEEWGWGGGDKLHVQPFIWSFYVIYKGDKTFSREDKNVFLEYYYELWETNRNISYYFKALICKL